MLAIEAVAGATIMQRWLPGVPVWVMSLVFMTLLTATNLRSVRSYGEFEFWFSSIKVAAIIAFLAIAAGFLLGVGGGDSPGLSNLTAHGGFAPNGAATILSGVVIVIFAFVGAEIVTIAAAEADEPERAVARATNQVVVRVLAFYVLAVFLIVCIVPWNDAKLGASPFIAALDRIGIPGAADIMNAVVVTAVLSCLNSGIYVASRMLFALARRGDAPRSLLELNHRGVPVKAICLSVVVGFVSVIFDAISPDKVFLFLVNSSGAVALFVYLLIAAAQLRMRRQLERDEPERLTLRMWGFPVADLPVDGGDRGRHRLDGVRRRRALAAAGEPGLACGGRRRRVVARALAGTGAPPGAGGARRQRAAEPLLAAADVGGAGGARRRHGGVRRRRALHRHPQQRRVQVAHPRARPALDAHELVRTPARRPGCRSVALHLQVALQAVCASRTSSRSIGRRKPARSSTSVPTTLPMVA